MKSNELIHRYLLGVASGEEVQELCLRCHTSLPYTTSERKRIPGIDPKEHNIDENCVDCHDPHNPRLEDM